MGKRVDPNWLERLLDDVDNREPDTALEGDEMVHSILVVAFSRREGSKEKPLWAVYRLHARLVKPDYVLMLDEELDSVWPDGDKAALRVGTLSGGNVKPEVVYETDNDIGDMIIGGFKQKPF